MNLTNGGRADLARSLFARLRPAVVAIDGPAASGKSTVGHRLAALIDYLFFDTGILYRAVTWAVLARGMAVQDELAVSQLAATLPIDIRAPQRAEDDGRHATVLMAGADVTWQLRSPAVDQNVSAVSAYREVRRVLTAHQRRIGLRYGAGDADKAGIVMVGRDIGSVVMPDAPLKIYMDATPAERARRRYEERRTRGQSADYASILHDLILRDQLDSGRTHAPLRPADDALVIDTSLLTPDEVVARIVEAAVER
jgi:cytidylate kinase